ncbi:MAG: hypothetical protein J0H31_16845, partial [Alphaproteobacteria bacterium]|nr:hypothetical protein [Alphaproteobacteria bacterium]
LVARNGERLRKLADMLAGENGRKVDTQVAQLKAQIDSSNQQNRQDFKLILDKVEAMTGEITKLTIAVGNVQYKQDNTPNKQ